MQRNLISSFLLLLLLCSLSSIVAFAQDCSPPPLAANSRNFNLFTPEQEMVLGELTYERISAEMRFVRDPALNNYVNQIGEKLIKHLPATGLNFKFFIIDIPEANAFNIPGGYVFISRKLIGFSANEDELAGVMAHELGHAVARHGAVDFSQLLKKVLNVSSVSDRKDIIEKYNLFLERWRTKRISSDRGHESEQQLEADRVGLFAMVAAGYDPTGFTSFFDRLVEAKGKTGSWFSDIFGNAKPEEKRLREMAKITDKLPPQCRENRKAAASEEFVKWQADIVSYTHRSRDEDLTALLWKKELKPKLRSDISHFVFSPDGKYFLAQDDFGITVVQREPLQVAFQIPAAEAREASFTPDGQFVVFRTENLRFEKWSIAEKKPVSIRELVLRRSCWERGLSPDGRFLACVDRATNLNIIDTYTGNKVWEKKEFYRLTFFEYLSWIVADAGDDDPERTRFFHIEFSPDSRYLTVSRSNRFRFRISIDGLRADESDNTLIALDLDTLKPINVGGDLKKVTQRPFAFLDSNRIVGMASGKLEDSGVFSFPEGKRQGRFLLGADMIKVAANTNYIVLKPVINGRMGIFDLNRNALVMGLNKADANIWNNLMVFEGASGKVLLVEVSYDEKEKILKRKEVGTIDLPASAIGNLSSAEVSDNFRWLGVSSKSRGAIWDLTSGERKVFVRGFRGALVANDGGAIGDFPKLEPQNHALVLLDPFTSNANLVREIPEGARQHGVFVLYRQSLKKSEKNEKEKENGKAPVEADEDPGLSREVHFELRHVVQDKVVWSRDFPKEAPVYFFDKFSGRLIFYWQLGSDVGKARLKEDPPLAARAKEMGNKDDDYLLEVVDAFTAKTIGTLLIETGKGSFNIQSGVSEQDWVVLHDSDNRTLAYSIKDGELRHRFFGAQAAINPTKNQIVVQNLPGELSFYDLESGERVHRLVFGSGAAFVRYSLDGKSLFVLSEQQTAYAFDLQKLKPQPVAEAVR